MNKVRIYYPNEDTCKWLDCLKKGYDKFGGGCSTHEKRLKELGNNKQCSFFDKNGYCLIETKQEFSRRYYCDNHYKLLKEYDEKVKNNIEILNEKKKNDNKCEKHSTILTNTKTS